MRETSIIANRILIVLFALHINPLGIMAQDDPSPSSNVGLIVFVSWRDGNAELYAINRDGSDLTRLTYSLGDDYTPAWSPSGEYLAFTSMRDGIVEGSQEIYVMKADGSAPINITNSQGYDAYPSWSPEGGEIVFVSFRDSNTEIYSMHVDGSNQKNLTNHPAEDMCPSWSPDGRNVAFSSNRNGNFDIYILSLEDNEVHQVTSDLTDDYCPVWLPGEDDTLVYGAYVLGRTMMVRISTDGTNKQFFDLLRFGDATPSWSPDGTEIVFTRSRDDNSDVYIMNEEGNEFQLTDHEERDSNPVWQPERNVSDDEAE